MAGNASVAACRSNLQGNVSEGSIQWPGDLMPPGARDMKFHTWHVADPECSSGSRTQYFFYRRSLDITESIEDVGGFNLHMFLFLTLAWFIIYVCLVRGIKSTGKVVYFTALFPYAVMIIFFGRAVTLPGFYYGLYYLFFPKFEMLLEPQVWLDAACQIFFSFGLAFGGIIAMASYNPRKNDCRRDAISVTVCNCATGLFAASIIFSILGNKAYETAGTCLNNQVNNQLPHVIAPNTTMNWLQSISGLLGEKNSFKVGQYEEVWTQLVKELEKEHLANLASNATSWSSHILKGALTLVSVNSTTETFSVRADPNAILFEDKKFWADQSYKLDLSLCDINADLKKAGGGTGLAFIAFTEAIDRFPFPPLWSVLFFLMLLALGVGSEFGTLIGVLTCFEDVIESRAQHKGKWYTAKWFVAGMIALVSYAVGILFVFGNGFYFVDVFDLFGATFPLLLIALFECLAVIFYAAKLKERTYKELLTAGIEKLRYWHKYIYDEELSIIWTIGWYLAPVVLVLVFLATLVKRIIEPFKYNTYNRAIGTLNKDAVQYPWWVLPVGLFLACMSILFIPFMFFYYKKYPWVGRASRSRSREGTRVVCSEAPAPPSNDANDFPVQQSSNSLGSILLNRLGTKSSGESPSENNTNERNKQLSFKDDEATARGKSPKENGNGEECTRLTVPPSANK